MKKKKVLNALKWVDLVFVWRFCKVISTQKVVWIRVNRFFGNNNKALPRNPCHYVSNHWKKLQPVISSVLIGHYCCCVIVLKQLRNRFHTNQLANWSIPVRLFYTSFVLAAGSSVRPSWILARIWHYSLFNAFVVESKTNNKQPIFWNVMRNV